MESVFVLFLTFFFFFVLISGGFLKRRKQLYFFKEWNILARLTLFEQSESWQNCFYLPAS